MDPSLIRTLLDTQDKAYRSALEVFVGQINGKMQALESTVSALTTSLEFTQNEVKDLKTEVQRLEREKENSKHTINNLTKEIQTTTKSTKDLEDRCNYQEDYNRRNNLQIVGLEELQGGETWEQTVKQVTKILQDKLLLPDIRIERAHRIGQVNTSRHRPIIARFQRYCDREAVLRNASKLRGTQIFINEDLCPASQQIRKDQLPLLKQARASGKLAYFRYTKLIIKDKQATLDSTVRGRNAAVGGIIGSSAAWGAVNDASVVRAAADPGSVAAVAVAAAPGATRRGEITGASVVLPAGDEGREGPAPVAGPSLQSPVTPATRKQSQRNAKNPTHKVR